MYLAQFLALCAGPWQTDIRLDRVDCAQASPELNWISNPTRAPRGESIFWRAEVRVGNSRAASNPELLICELYWIRLRRQVAGRPHLSK